jgi:aminoglycoside phosphotransferase (APT) family kinase protein
MSKPIDDTRPVRQGEEVNVAALESHLRGRLPDLEGALTVEQFPHGHSNLTYLLRWGGNEWVMRRPPFGNRVKSAHDMGREHRILSRLCDVYSPAPRPILFCDDESVLGAPFYVMERRRGVIHRRGPMPLPDAAHVRRLCVALIDNFAKLHSLDYRAAGLADLGRPDGYVERQITGWTKRYRDAQTENVADMETLITWLPAHTPPASGASIIHNDYKFDNVMFAADDPDRIVAVLDWEMATLGDPLMDLGTTLCYWVEAGDPPAFKETAFGPTHAPGALTRQEVVDRYAEQSGRPIGDLRFYYVFGLFKTAVVIQQIYARYVRGHTADKRFANMNTTVSVLCKQAIQALNRDHVFAS